CCTRGGIVHAVLMGALASVALAAWPVSAGATTWNLPAQDISSSGANGLYPQVAVAPDSAAGVCWIRNTGGPNQAQVSTRTAGSGVFGPVADLSVAGQSTTFDCAIATGPDGTTTAVWSAFIAGNRIVQEATRAPGASAFGPLANVSLAGATGSDPDIAFGPDGSTTIAWTSSNPGTAEVVKVATRPAGSSTFGAPVNISLAAAGEPATNPQVVVAANGQTTVGWHRFNGAINIPQVATREASSSTYGAPVALSSGPGQEVELAYAPDGSLTAVWWETSTYRVAASARPAGSTAFGPVELLSAAGQTAGAARIAVSPEGETTVVWQRDNGSQYVIQATTRAPGSSVFGQPVDLSDASQTALQPELAVAPDGAVTVAWYRSNGSENIVQASTREPGAATYGVPVDLSATGQNATQPALASAADGAVTAAWQRQDGSNWIVQAATSSPTSYALETQGAGTGSGTVASAPAGIDCGSSCRANFLLSTRVTLTATPRSGSTFTGWGGACTGSTNTCTLNMLGNRSVAATFTADPPAPPSNRFTITSSSARGPSVRTRVRVPGPGRITQRGTYRTGGSSSAATRTACTAARTAAGAGTFTLTCRLDSAARKQRRKGKLRVRIRTTYTPTGGTARSTYRTVTFRSLKPNYTG
ncbi:MAG: hypothetical protein KGR19_09990, partial [Acidobacteria bacterium]|nr:hypothetical protein [Acidobacteriota bacterium]